MCQGGDKHSLHWGLNPGPSVYKTDALPLSYRGIKVCSEVRSNVVPCVSPKHGTFVLKHLPSRQTPLHMGTHKQPAGPATCCFDLCKVGTVAFNPRPQACEAVVMHLHHTPNVRLPCTEHVSMEIMHCHNISKKKMKSWHLIGRVLILFKHGQPPLVDVTDGRWKPQHIQGSTTDRVVLVLTLSSWVC